MVRFLSFLFVIHPRGNLFKNLASCRPVGINMRQILGFIGLDQVARINGIGDGHGHLSFGQRQSRRGAFHGYILERDLAEWAEVEVGVLTRTRAMKTHQTTPGTLSPRLEAWH